jgi:Lar family restriction alleviation protein
MERWKKKRKSEMSKFKLKPCPFCGSTNIEHSKIWIFIACNNCKAQISRPSEKEAVEAWNRRAENIKETE